MHYYDGIMSAMASQITSLTIVYSTIHSDADQKKTSKLRITGLSAWNSPVTGKFPAQMASNAKMFPFDDVIQEVPENRYAVWYFICVRRTADQCRLRELPICFLQVNGTKGRRHRRWHLWKTLISIVYLIASVSAKSLFGIMPKVT